jgi:hypothetical protein
MLGFITIALSATLVFICTLIIFKITMSETEVSDVETREKVANAVQTSIDADSEDEPAVPDSHDPERRAQLHPAAVKTAVKCVFETVCCHFVVVLLFVSLFVVMRNVQSSITVQKYKNRLFKCLNMNVSWFYHLFVLRDGYCKEFNVVFFVPCSDLELYYLYLVLTLSYLTNARACTQEF